MVLDNLCGNESDCMSATLAFMLEMHTVAGTQVWM